MELGDAGAAKGVAAHLIGVEAGVFGSLFYHVQDVISGKTAAGGLAGAPVRRLKEWRVLVVTCDVEDDADVWTESRTRPPLDLPERYP